MTDHSTDLDNSSRALVRIQPGAVFVISIVLSILISRAWNLQLFPERLVCLSVTGAILGATAIGLAAWSIILIKRAGSTVAPGAPVRAMVTEGPFRISRNPMYLSLVLLQIGVGLILHSGIGILMAIPLALALNHLAIVPEEKCMKSIFGEQFTSYAQKTGRWLWIRKHPPSKDRESCQE